MSVSTCNLKLKREVYFSVIMKCTELSKQIKLFVEIELFHIVFCEVNKTSDV